MVSVPFGEEPADQRRGGFAAVALAVVVRVEKVAEAGMAGGQAARQRRFRRVPRAAVADHRTR